MQELTLRFRNYEVFMSGGIFSLLYFMAASFEASANVRIIFIKSTTWSFE
jgi:hypothetical protein